jgi:hypothetical protein
MGVDKVIVALPRLPGRVQGRVSDDPVMQVIDQDRGVRGRFPSFGPWPQKDFRDKREIRLKKQDRPHQVGFIPSEIDRRYGQYNPAIDVLKRWNLVRQNDFRFVADIHEIGIIAHISLVSPVKPVANNFRRR